MLSLYPAESQRAVGSKSRHPGGMFKYLFPLRYSKHAGIPASSHRSWNEAEANTALGSTFGGTGCL